MATSGLLRRVLFIALFVRLTAFGSGMVTLAWNSSADPLVTGYNLYYGGASGVYTNKINVGNATNHTISGLVGGRSYYFAATTYSVSGLESALSAELRYLIPTQAVLSIQIAWSNGAPASLCVDARGMVPDQWALQSSTNLETWTTLAQGTNLAVNFLMPAGNLPRQFFRLLGQ